METQTKTSGARDFFINLGAIVSLYTLVISLINLLFTVIDVAYPKVVVGYNYAGSSSISWPVATLIIFTPIFIILMWLMEKSYTKDPERKNMGIHKWLTYITLFLSGVAMAVDLIMVLYYFLDGQDLTAGFVLKILAVLIVAGCVFAYYISDIREKLTPNARKIWRVVALVIVVASIVWGFSVLGSPSTQRLYKYDDQNVNNLMVIQNAITEFYNTKNTLPKSLVELSAENYSMVLVDAQNNKPYEYEKTGNLTYSLCAEFNKDSKDALQPNVYTKPIGYPSWTHPAGHYCFSETIIPIKK